MKGFYRGDNWPKHRGRRGFTIVELLIVVVVIAILAAITVVAYNGITAQAKESALRSELTTVARKLIADKVVSDSFPSSKPNFVSSDLSYFGSVNAFCVYGESGGKAFRISEKGNIEQGSCAPPVATTMQEFTAAHCALQPVYNGTNPAAIVSLNDLRGGSTRTYEVAKLADGKCWMLSNLKLGSATGSIALTSSDSDVVNSFTLPQLIEGGWPGYGPPQALGPLYGDTSSGSTNYGYLYNWYAATAGESNTTMPAGSGNAQHSICPANWRLPSGGSWNSPSNDFSNLNARMAGLSGVTDPAYTSSSYSGGTFSANWRYTGAFRGVYSGDWWASDEGFYGRGSFGRLWSRTADQSNSSSALYQGFSSSQTGSGSGSGGRNVGFAVRCLLR